ncbi:hypothetical protein [Micrococcoides hystricis]|uniref:Uncharacterized protein n=1 Tax=Micrococcoides hystricis TaxID=1572761 RepID=A0ABV6P8Y7_9MICC
MAVLFLVVGCFAGPSQSGPPEGSVATSNGAYAVTPVGGWEVEFEPSIAEPREGDDPSDTLVFTHRDSSAAGKLYVGLIVRELIPSKVVHVNSERLEHLDPPSGKDFSGKESLTYLVETRHESEIDGRHWWQLDLVSVMEEGDEVGANGYRSARSPSVDISISFLAEEEGAQGRTEVEEFIASDVRDDAYKLLRSLYVDQ